MGNICIRPPHHTKAARALHKAAREEMEMPQEMVSRAANVAHGDAVTAGKLHQGWDRQGLTVIAMVQILGKHVL